MMKLTFLIVLMSLLSCNSDEDKKLISLCNSNSLPEIEVMSVKEIMKKKLPEGSLIAVKGIFRYNFEDVAVFDRKNEYDEALWTRFGFDPIFASSSLTKLSEKRVIVYGRLNLSEKGHMNYYQGMVDSIFCIKQVR